MRLRGQKTYHEQNKLQLQEYRKNRYDENKETYLLKCKNYYENNKEKILLKRKKEEICECGIKYTYGHKNRHMKTKKHLSFIASKQ